jgi:ATP-dependent DNA helicase RecQ
VLSGLDHSRPQSMPQLVASLPEVGANRLAVCLSVLRDAGLAASDRSRAWRRRDATGTSPAAPLEALAQAYQRRAEHDREGLERIVFYAQTGFCRWRVLLEHFDEAPTFADGRCGHCDNCLQPPAPTMPAARTAEVSSAPPAFARGAAVRVPRYGDGRVERATADEVDVSFADGRTRTFVAAFVEAA